MPKCFVRVSPGGRLRPDCPPRAPVLFTASTAVEPSGEPTMRITRAVRQTLSRGVAVLVLLSAAADRGPANGSAQLFIDLNKAGAVAELHIYQKGRHGFGAAYGSPEFSPWMAALQHFLRQGGFLPKEQ